MDREPYEGSQVRTQREQGSMRRWVRIVIGAGAVAAMFSLESGYAQTPPVALAAGSATVQKVPGFFKFQARVSQGKQPLGTASFTKIFVTILDNTSGTVCTEEFSNVEVRNSVLNLTIGRGASCDLDELVKLTNSLSLKVCLESQTNCLKPIEIGSVPFATKATFAHHAEEATEATTAVQSHYAHRMAADATLLNPQALGKGYFDFYTPPDQTAGFIQWAPVRLVSGQGPAATLNICAKEPLAGGTEGPAPLGELVLQSNLTTMKGRADIQGDASIAGGATIGGAGSVQQGLSVKNTGGLGLDVQNGAEIAGGVTVTQGAAQNALFVEGLARITGGVGISASGAIVAVDGKGLVVQDGASVSGGLAVSGGTGDTLAVTGRASVSQGIQVTQGEAQNALGVTGATELEGQVTIRPGASNAPLTCSSPATFTTNTTMGRSDAVDASTMTVYAKTVHEGKVELKGTVMTSHPIPGVVANNDVGTAHIQAGAVTNEKLGIVLGNNEAGERPGFVFCSGPTAHNAVPGSWKFCALTDVQISTAPGRCKVYRVWNSSTASYQWTVQTGSACCAVDCF